MKFKKVIFSIAIALSFVAVSCTNNGIADNDELYIQGVDKTKIRKPEDRHKPYDTDRTKTTTTSTDDDDC